MRKFMIIIFIGISTFTFANDYKSFTDKKGRTIKAKIIKVDYKYNKVTLELENKKKATVSIDIFSDKDSDYIYTWKPPITMDEGSSTSEKLSKLVVKKIARKYKESWNNKDYDEVSSMLLGGGFTPTVSELQNFGRNNYWKLRHISIGDVNDYSFHVAYSLEISPSSQFPQISDKFARFRSIQKSEGWCLLTPNGKIKYDSVLNPHPIEKACTAIERLLGTGAFLRDSVKASDILSYQVYLYQELHRVGFSQFKMRTARDIEESKEDIEKIIEWLEENGDKYDTSDPKVFYPSELFDDLKDQLKLDKKALHHV